MQNSLKYFLVTIVTFLTGYLFLRLAYFNTMKDPYAQEIVLIVLGTIATLSVTAALISKQSEVELQKEQRVKVFNLKSELYLDLINFIEKIISAGKILEKDLVSLEFLTHKISIIASHEVLKEYTHLIEAVKKVAFDHKITPLESEELSKQLARLCARIRYDLILNDNHKKDIQHLLEKNIDKI